MKYPLEFSFLEQCQVQAVLDNARRSALTYDGNYSAPWLLSSIDAAIWKISKGAETRVINGEFVNYEELSWATVLSDGTNLLDDVNKNFLLNLQKIVFLARELPGGPDTLTTHKLFFWTAKVFTRWIYLHQDILDPRTHFFNKVKREHLHDFFTAMGQGGSAFALLYPQRFLQAVFPLALNRNPTAEELSDPLSLDVEDCRKVAQLIALEGATKSARRNVDGQAPYINRGYVAKIINTDENTVRGGPRWRIFLEQFSDSETLDFKGARRRSSGTKNEYAGQRDLTNEEAQDKGTSEKTLGKYFDDLKTLIALHPHLPHVCPDPAEFKPKELKRLIKSVTRSQQHTPWIPLKTALSYTTEALRWVHVYGDDLVTLFLNTYRSLHLDNRLVSAPIPEKQNPNNADFVKIFREYDAARASATENLDIPKSLWPLNIIGWRNYQHLDGQKAFQKLRESPSLLDAVMVLVGAIAVVVSMMKPMRESELRALKRNCLFFAKGDGYWLSHDVRKKNVGDVRPVDARPIPTISAKAIQLLQRLTDGLKEIIGVTDPWLLENLFTLPSFGRYEAAITEVMSPRHLNYTLDAFCDYVAIPPDNHGRRWYVRVHEMRKSFLIVFFWTYRYANLDAARWIAGHENAEHLYSYIEANFPGEELPALEAEYASQVLRDYQATGDSDQVKNVELLHNEVCRHFSVKDVSWIEEEVLKDWLAIQFELGDFEIYPYSVTTRDGMSTVIAFRIKSREEN